MNNTLILFATTSAAILAMTSIASLTFDVLFRKRTEILQRLQNEFNPTEKQSSTKSPLFRDLKMNDAKSAGRRDQLSRSESFRLHLEQSGLPWTPFQVGCFCSSLSAIAALIAYVFTNGTVVAVSCGIAGAVIPLIIVEFVRRRRVALFCQQLPEAFDHMKRSVRAGQSLMIAMQQVAKDFRAPLADEFSICCQQHGLGLSQSLALQNLARRINVMELRLFVVSAVVHQEVGGNLAELLTTLSNVVRQRLRLATRAKALTAEGRMQAMVLALLPLIAGAALRMLNPDYASVLFEQPRILAALFASEIIGVIWIKTIISVDY